MKILITGGNGFVAKELSFYFSRIGHQVVSTDRNNFEPTTIQSIHNVLQDSKFDILIHTAESLYVF
jgi:dTDP-4-dehydrorhamnose reductase